MQGFLEKHVGPIAHKVSSFNVVKGLMSGMMATMPVTLGVALLSIINGLPIPPLQAFLASTGMSATITDVLVVTMNLGAIYMCASVSYSYGKVLGNKGLTSTVAAIGVLLLLIPLGHAEDGSTFIVTRYLGSSGLFVALLVALIVPKALNFLMKHIAIPMPDSVPQFVNDSLSPMFCAIVIFTTAALLKWGMGLTSYGDVFNLINSTIATPVMFLGSSPWAVVIYFTLCNLLFFFGIHPSVLMGVYMPVSRPALLPTPRHSLPASHCRTCRSSSCSLSVLLTPLAWSLRCSRPSPSATRPSPRLPWCPHSSTSPSPSSSVRPLP